jgi:hypothetical protein
MNPKSYVAVYRATGQSTLIGAIRASRSCRYGALEDAYDRLNTALAINRAAGIECDGEVEGVNLPPEIFLHCGRYAQTVGGFCPGCGKLLSRADADQFVAKNCVNLT